MNLLHRLLLQSRRAVRQGSPGSHANGFIIVPALLTAVVILAALVIEISRSSSIMQTSVQTADARNAVAAAEFGLQALLDQLNNDNNDYLLATKLVNASGTGNWQTVTSTDLTNCNIKSPPTAPSANRIPGVSTNSSNSAVVLPTNASASYTLTGYEPPVQVGTTPSGCTMFGNLLGGRARFTVRGIIQRNGTVYASYDLVREVNIRPVSIPVAQNNLGLVITGDPSRSKTGSPFHIVYDQNGDGLIGTSGSTITEPLGNVNCILCTSPSQLDTGGTSLGTVFPGAIPNFPTFPNLLTDPTYAPLLGVAEAPNLDEDNLGNPVLFPYNYPYNHATSTDPAVVTLVPGCKFLTVGGVPNAEIGCKLSTIKGFGDIRVRGDARPVKLFVSGDFIVSGGNYLKATDGNAATSESQDAMTYWKNIWIYGKPGTPSAGASNCDQEVTLSGSGEAFGVRLWFPLGKAKISGGSFGNRDFIGSMWTCIFNQGSGNTGFLVPTDLVSTWNLGGTTGGFRYRAQGAL